jgi:hypothetical protein
VSYVDVDIVSGRIVYDHQAPIFSPVPNTFFSHGISIGNIWSANGKSYLNFMGWQLSPGEHWRGELGFCELKGLDLINPKLMIGRNPSDPISVSYGHVLNEDGVFRVWYGSTLSWTSSNGEMVHTIKSATSLDGRSWSNFSQAVPFELGIAQAFSRPTVLVRDGVYHMWFSFRSGDGTAYRIGYSRSLDGVSWTFPCQSLGPSDHGWDSEMVCYPSVFVHKGKLFMLYNGQGYGRSGFGLAVLESELG